MPVIFEDSKREPFIIDKDGTKFYFNVSEGAKKQVRLNMMIDGRSDFGTMFTSMFKEALYKWENLKNGKGDDIPFSIAIRDKLVDDTDIFSENDILDVLGIGVPSEGEQSQKKHGASSTSKKPSTKQ